MKRAFRILGTALLATLAAVGVLLSAAYTVVTTDTGRAFLLPRVLRAVDDAIEGSIQVRALRLLPGGGLEIAGARVLDGDGDVVLTVESLRVHLDLRRLRSRSIGFRADIEKPLIVLRREEDGSLSLARAFRPTHPSTRRDTGPSPWTVRLPRLTVRGGAVRYVDAAGRTAFEAESIDLDGRAIHGPARSRVDASVRGAMTVPERAPISLDVVGGLLDGQLSVRTFRAAVGDTALDAALVLDPRTWRGQAALLVLALGARDLDAVAPRVPLADDIVGTLYAESNGERATAALDLRPRGGGGDAQGSAAARLPPEALRAGVSLSLRHLDLSRVLRGLPVTDLALDARGHASGHDLASLRGALVASLDASRIGGGRLGPAELRASADRGVVEVTRLDVAAPGLTLRAQGHWRSGAALGGKLTLDVADLATARRNAELLASRKLPELSGSVRIEANVSGTERRPIASLRIASPALRAGSVTADSVSLTGQATGPLTAPVVSLEGAVARLTAGAVDARGVALRGRFDGTAGELELTGDVPKLGNEALALRAAGRLGRDRRTLTLSTLTLGLPGDRFELQKPATVLLDGGSVDELALASGAQRVVLSGGVRGPATRRALDTRLRLEAIDLARWPRALLPHPLGVAGLVSADVTAKGSPSAPVVEVRLTLSAAAVAGLDGLSAEGRATYDGGRRRVRWTVTARRASGGTVDVEGDLPIELGRAPGASALALDAAVRGWSVPDLLRVAKVELPEPLDGVAGAELHVAGRVGAPTLRASATLEHAQYGEFDGIAATLRADDPGTELTTTASVDVATARALDLETSVRLRLADALREPRAVVAHLRSAPLKLVATVPGFDLARVAGRARIPEDLRGRIQARAELGGSAVAPRGTLQVEGIDVAWAGYTGVAARLEAAARDAATALKIEVALQGTPVVQGAGTLALPIERLGHADERERAALEARVEIPRADLRGTARGSPVPLTGTVEGFAAVAGTLAAPRVDLRLTGSRIEVASRPLGDVHVEGKAVDGRAHAALQLAVTTGGTLDASVDAETDLSIEAFRSGAVRTAPAKARLVADQLDLGFLPAAAPGIVRSASGKLGADLVAAGPLTRMVPKGTVALEKGAISVVEFGEWTDLVVSAALSDRDFQLKELSAKRRGGKLLLTGSVDGVGEKTPAKLRAELRMNSLTLQRAGQDLATLDLDAKLTGTVSSTALDAELTVPGATVKLPNRIPRRIQPLGERPDIVVGRPRKQQAVAIASRGPANPYHARVQVLVPGHFFVKSDNPRVNIELRADVTADWSQHLALEGDVETVRGQVEPIGGRIFDVKRGRVRFTGDPTLGMLDVTALYNNPQAKVTVTVSGTVEKPDVKLTSEPPLEESQIALLIATGRTDLKAGTGGVSAVGAEDAGKAALGAVATQMFRDVLSDKLPVDTVALDSSQIRAGKYLTDKIYVGYTRRFNADPEKGENPNEVRVEYQISPRWTFQSRYGDAQSGGASLVWSKDY